MRMESKKRERKMMNERMGKKKKIEKRGNNTVDAVTEKKIGKERGKIEKEERRNEKRKRYSK